jgi:predicted enzyme related to lactoylglutathione lyase
MARTPPLRGSAGIDATRYDSPMEAIADLNAIAIDCPDPRELARFWGAVLGTGIAATLGDDHYIDLAPVSGVPILRFQRVAERKSTKNRLHLDLDVGDLEAASTRIEALGGRRVSERPLTEHGYTWIVMEDPAGNEFCIGTMGA